MGRFSKRNLVSNSVHIHSFTFCFCKGQSGSAGAMYCITADAKETGNEGGGNGDGGTITAAHIADAVLKKNTEIQNLIFIFREIPHSLWKLSKKQSAWPF